jgi:hypothetical protein
MDTIKFVAVNSFLEDYLVVDILINGYRLIDLLQAVESRYARAEGRISLAGAYEGLPPLMVLPPNKHYWGDAHKEYLAPDGRVVLLEYAYSGVPGDWTFAAQIEVTGEFVSWSNMGNVQRPDWDYSEIGPFKFDLRQYRDALDEAKAKSY